MYPVNNKLMKIRDEISGLVNRGIYFDPKSKRKVYSGYIDRILFDWDQYFEAIIQIYMGFDQEMIKNGILCYLDNQKENGLIPRAIPIITKEENEHCKPFLCQIILLMYKIYNELSLIDSEIINKLKKYIGYWINDMDSDKSGLSEWMSSVHTGMDNQHERAGYWNDRFCKGVDLNSYLYRELVAFSKILYLKGYSNEANQYSILAEKKKKKILSIMWDESDNFFYDIDMRSGKMIKVKSISSFMPLWAKIATDEKAEKIIRNHLFNKNEFWTEYPVSALARSEKGYSQKQLPDDIGCNWRANTWIPTNYMIYHGLINYGYYSEASLLAEKTKKIIEKSGSWEYYNSETGEGIKQFPFFGWSLLGYFMEYEEEIKVDITEISHL